MALEKARKKGKRLERPRARLDQVKAAQLKAEGMTYSETGKLFGVSRTTVSWRI
jgi:DNA invertase Pin-like site-specific DNA recombinase